MTVHYGPEWVLGSLFARCFRGLFRRKAEQASERIRTEKVRAHIVNEAS